MFVSSCARAREGRKIAKNEICHFADLKQGTGYIKRVQYCRNVIAVRIR